MENEEMKLYSLSPLIYLVASNCSKNSGFYGFGCYSDNKTFSTTKGYIIETLSLDVQNLPLGVTAKMMLDEKYFFWSSKYFLLFLLKLLILLLLF